MLKRIKMILVAAIAVAGVLSSNLSADEFTINLKGDLYNETISFTMDIKVDENKKIIPNQIFDVIGLDNFKSLKVLTAKGQSETLVEERELVIYYKTSLNIQGLKIRNLYKVAVASVYDSDKTIDIQFKKDHYQRINYFLRYHNIGSEVIKDIDNLYGAWEDTTVKVVVKK